MTSTAKENERWVKALTRDTNEAGDILLHCAKLYAAMFADFVRRAETTMIGVDGVRMNDGAIKSTRQFLIEDTIEGQITGRMLREQPDSKEWVSEIREIRSKMTVILAACPPVPPADPLEFA